MPIQASLSASRAQRGLGFAVPLARQAGSHSSRALSEVALGGMLHIPERHVRRGMAEELLESHDGHAGLHAVDAELVAVLVAVVVDRRNWQRAICGPSPRPSRCDVNPALRMAFASSAMPQQFAARLVSYPNSADRSTGGQVSLSNSPAATELLSC